MRYYLFFLITILGQNAFFQEINLEGQYSMLFEEEYKNQNCTINFNKASYERKLSDGRKISGIFEIQKYRIVLKDKETPFEMVILKSSIPNDTIPFGTVDKRDKSKPTGDIVIHQGRMIKMK